MGRAGRAGLVDQETWETVKARQKTLAYAPDEPTANPLNARRRPRHLFASLVKCGCGGGYAMISKALLGCTTARNKGTCDNRVNIRRDALEASILSGLRTHLMEPELFREFCAEFTCEVNRLRIERGTDLAGKRRELERTERELDKAILDGVPGAQFKDRVGQLEDRKAELTAFVANANEPPPLLHPNMAETYGQRIAGL